MPSESTSSLEPQFTTTSCMCPYAEYGMHETSCISSNSMKPPNPRAGKRAWKQYYSAKRRAAATPPDQADKPGVQSDKEEK